MYKKIGFLILATTIFIVGCSKRDSKQNIEIDLSTALLIEFEENIDFANVDRDIKFLETDKNKNKNKNKNNIDVLINRESDNSAIIIPLYNLKDKKVEISSKYKIVSTEIYEHPVFIENEKNLDKIVKTLKERDANRAETAKNSDNISVESASVEEDFSGTNVQVEGVDEGDIIKTDGQHIYFLRDKNVVIVKANGAKMELLSSIEIEPFMILKDIYIEGEKLILISEREDYYQFMHKEFQEFGLPLDMTEEEYNKQYEEEFKEEFIEYEKRTKIAIYDIKDKKKPELIRTIVQNGNYFNSRKKENELYVLTSYYLDYSETNTKVENTKDKNTKDVNINSEKLIGYKDELFSTQYQKIPLTKLMIQPGFLSRNNLEVIMVLGIDLDDVKEPEITSFFGERGHIYMSLNNLYLTYMTNDWDYFFDYGEYANDSFKPQTIIKKFAMDKMELKYEAEAKISGWLINQFSLDENKGENKDEKSEYLRVAYTKSFDFSEEGSFLSIFDKDMKLVGNLENIAPSERIHSVRFMGDKVYMVTFKNVDPLFVIDLKEPNAPKILGYLKIPGVSEYLHPYDENTLIGFGHDTTINKDGEPVYIGLKMSLFDVSDTNNPIERDVIKLGDRGTRSELISNHKALMYDRKRGIMGFPITVAKIKNEAHIFDEHGFPYNGELVFQGAYIYKISPEKFNFQGKISHYATEEYDYYARESEIKRLVYIGDTVYTLSTDQIKATNLHTMQTLSTLSLLN